MAFHYPPKGAWTGRRVEKHFHDPAAHVGWGPAAPSGATRPAVVGAADIQGKTETWLVNALGLTMFLAALVVASFGLACLVYAYLAAHCPTPVPDPSTDPWTGWLP